MPRAELTLYTGYTDARGRFQGVLNPASQEEYDKQRVQEAVNLVWTRLGIVGQPDIRVTGWDTNIVRSEEEAQTLRDKVREVLPDIRDAVRPSAGEHGHLYFYRLLMFPDYTEAQIEVLISKLESVGCKPNPNHKPTRFLPPMNNPWAWVLKFRED